MDFKEAVQKTRNAKKILVVSHYDCDGICSAKILSEALRREGKIVEVMVAKEISEEIIEKVKKIESDLIIFSDLGSGYLSLIPKDRNIVILDHHEPETPEVSPNITHINPCTEGKTLCGSGVCYCFAKGLSKNNFDLVDFAVVGSIGDNQVQEGENKNIVDEAEKLGRLQTEKGLNIFGHVNRPLSRSLMNSNHIPLKSESEAIQFLRELNIEINGNGKIKSYCDLADREKEILKNEILKEALRQDLAEPSKVFSNIYILTQKPKKIMDAQELSTTLNAFGRLEKFDEVFEVLSGNLEKIDEVMYEYRQKISSGLSWLNKNLPSFPTDELAMYIDAKNNVDENIIGTIVSIYINNAESRPVVIGLAEGKEGIKISARSKNDKVDLDEVISRVCAECGGYGGGHPKAAGGKIALGKAGEFIEKMQKGLKGHSC
ncbi:MAG: DHH family phosphoesterase [Candidatus Aenigmarchaeota archaeon]|nr:DHH family phosphoesterase [Candidatus Aenigmarchaeota archaeon]